MSWLTLGRAQALVQRMKESIAADSLNASSFVDCGNGAGIRLSEIDHYGRIAIFRKYSDDGPWHRGCTYLGLWDFESRHCK